MPFPPVVNVQVAEQLVEAGAVVLDTRSAAAFYADGHIPGAVRVSWRIGTSGGLTQGALADPVTVAQAFGALGVRGDLAVLVVGDWGRGWGEEGRIFWDLEYLGHPDVHVLEGGMAAWTAPRTRMPTPSPTASSFTPAPRPDVRVTGAGLAAALAGPNPPVVLDVREANEFAGATPFGESRGGHIRGAVNRPWRELLVDPSVPAGASTVVVTCTGGVRSGMAYLMLRDANIVTVANYDGGMWDWSRTTNDVVR